MRVLSGEQLMKGMIDMAKFKLGDKLVAIRSSLPDIMTGRHYRVVGIIPKGVSNYDDDPIVEGIGHTMDNSTAYSRFTVDKISQHRQAISHSKLYFVLGSICKSDCCKEGDKDCPLFQPITEEI